MIREEGTGDMPEDRKLYRRNGRRGVLFFALGAMLAIVGTAPAVKADSTYIAFDVETSNILVQGDPDAPRRPASLTKMMTVYLAFEALARGAIEEDEEVEVSSQVAKTPPMKFGFKTGDAVPFLEAVEAALIGSKNDAAVLVAEAIAGTEAKFVERMNETARRLGMANTTFANATGLPAKGQTTTARDIALLARALLRDFPDRAAIFAKTATKAMKRSVTTTNPLFGRVKGAQGMKTGFTCAGGYSIAALVERKGRRLVAVSMAHRSKQTRLRAVRALIDAAFDAEDGGSALVPMQVKLSDPPDIGACNRGPDPAMTAEIPPEDIALFQTALNAARKKLEARRWMDQPPPPKPSRKQGTGLSDAPLRGWGVFLGAHASPAEARAIALEIRKAAKLSRQTHLSSEGRERDKRYLSLLYGLDRSAASAACRAARQLSRFCLALSPERLLNNRARWRR